MRKLDEGNLLNPAVDCKLISGHSHDFIAISLKDPKAIIKHCVDKCKGHTVWFQINNCD